MYSNMFLRIDMDLTKWEIKERGNLYWRMEDPYRRKCQVEEEKNMGHYELLLNKIEIKNLNTSILSINNIVDGKR